ncbi:MAG: class IIb bacteriocin, lactobin A/cerein 7B family [Bacilli bacterium]|nr:class IIb bacteriocin, lactobin A/cerein 7B family [Bacilli bacterium]
MKNLSDKDLMMVNGGAVKIGAIVGIAAGITFIIGLIDGLFRPLKCN